jgi:hypothetical protein
MLTRGNIDEYWWIPATILYRQQATVCIVHRRRNLDDFSSWQHRKSREEAKIRGDKSEGLRVPYQLFSRAHVSCERHRWDGDKTRQSKHDEINNKKSSKDSAPYHQVLDARVRLTDLQAILKTKYRVARINTNFIGIFSRYLRNDANSHVFLVMRRVSSNTV